MTGRIPYIAVGNEELATAPLVGETAACPSGHQHAVDQLGDGLLQTIDCDGHTYLIGLRGRSMDGIGSGGYLDEEPES
jgi:hypothetical protein